MSGIPRNSERPERTFGRSAYIALPIDSCFVYWLRSFVFVPLLKRQQKLSFFLRKREWHLNLKSMKMFIRVVQSFNIIVWPRPFFKWPNLKCHVGHINQFDQFLDWTLRVLDIRLQYWERWFFSKWHRRLGRKVIQILPTGDEPMTFCLLVQMLYHWATGHRHIRST